MTDMQFLVLMASSLGLISSIFAWALFDENKLKLNATIVINALLFGIVIISIIIENQLK